MNDRIAEFWRLKEVTRRTGLSRSTIYRRLAAREFPIPRDLGGGAVAWWAGDVIDWMHSRPQAQPTPSVTRTVT